MELKKIAVFSAPNDPVCPQHQSIIQQPLQILKSFSQIYDDMHRPTTSTRWSCGLY